MVEARRAIDFREDFGPKTGEGLNLILQGVESPSVAATENGGKFDKKGYARRAGLHLLKDSALAYVAPKVGIAAITWIGIHFTPLAVPAILADIALAVYFYKKVGDAGYDGVQLIRSGFGGRKPRTLR